MVVEIPFVGEEVYPVDSLHQFDTTYVYKFYTNDTEIKIPLLEVEYVPETNSIISTKWVNFPDNVKVNNRTKESFSMFPNPATNYLIINSNENIININILNLKGQIVLQSTSKRIDINNLPSSIYLIEVNTSKTTTRKKLIVK